MNIKIYGHPFSSYTWKVLIAAYERSVVFEFCMIDADHPENTQKIKELSPTGQFPALVHGDREVTQSNSVIEYLDRIGDTQPMIPGAQDPALNARMMTYVFDTYVADVMQKIVSEALRPTKYQDEYRVHEAKANLDKSYAWLSRRISKKWACGDQFTIADCAAAPALFYADWVHPIEDDNLKQYRERLLSHPSVIRTVEDARPYRSFFPLDVPESD